MDEILKLIDEEINRLQFEHKICHKHMLPDANDLWIKIQEARHIKEIIQSLEA